MGALTSLASGRSYQLIAQLAQGGMGEVFVGREKVNPGGGPRRLFAIKTLLPTIATDPTMLSRFLDEARLAAKLVHPAIAQLHDFGEAAGRPFAVFELLQGADFADCLSSLIDRKAKMPVEVAVAVIAGACVGLDFAHKLVHDDGQTLGVVHRDLSPSNLFVTSRGQVKVLDFGAATGRDRVTRTATGLIIGKLEYMSPEQVRGEPLGPHTDVFALGLCLFEALTLFRPYHSPDEREQIRRIYLAEIPPLAELRPDLPFALGELIQKACAHDPAQRFESAAAFGAALEGFLKGLTQTPAPELLTSFYEACFGTQRDERRAARLAEILLELDGDPTSGDRPFVWDAPTLNLIAKVVPSPSILNELLGASLPPPPPPPSAPDARPALALVPLPAKPPPDPRLAYLFAAGVILVAGGLGFAAGKLGAYFLGS